MSGTTWSLHLEHDLNRVFADALAEVAATELRIVTDRIVPGGVGPIERIERGRTLLLRFPTPRTDGADEAVANADEAADEVLARVIGRLSASAALFRHHPGLGPVREGAPIDLLEPVTIAEDLVHGTELVTTQRYRGKTNERLTRAILNATLATAGIDPSRPSGTILDPLCGRGTTLNWALAYGLDSIGIELDRTSIDQHAAFLQTWAKRKRLPHHATRHRDRNAERRWLSAEIAVDRAALKGGRAQRVTTFRADGADETLPIKRGSVDALVTALPYGVQHTGGGDDERFDPIALLTRTLPVWRRWLRPGGAVGLAWNARQADRREVTRVLVEAGYEPVVAGGGHTMRHVVDASIDRDVVIAARP